MNSRITGPAGVSVDPVSRESLAQNRLSYSGLAPADVLPNADRTHASQLPDPGVRDYPGLPARKTDPASTAEQKALITSR
ncbi:MAG TPA: hypothetical protein VJR04_13020 [Terriglobales bacterium]|nr:hypothetical protein [Terriglobales bacterium]